MGFHTRLFPCSKVSENHYSLEKKEAGLITISLNKKFPPSIYSWPSITRLFLSGLYYLPSLSNDIFVLKVHVLVFLSSSFLFPVVADALLEKCMDGRASSRWTMCSIARTRKEEKTSFVHDVTLWNTRKSLTLVVTDGCWPPLLLLTNAWARTLCINLSNEQDKRVFAQAIASRPVDLGQREGRRERERENGRNKDSYCTIGHSIVVFKVIKLICICTCSSTTARFYNEDFHWFSFIWWVLLMK